MKGAIKGTPAASATGAATREVGSPDSADQREDPAFFYEVMGV